jgi:hypothetical protein
MLPLNALILIGEYSKPITRPDWRTFKRTISEAIYIHDIDALYEFDNTCDLFKIVHTHMHIRIDMCLCDMTQEELDAFINYPHNVISNFENILYIVVYVEFVCLLYLFICNLLHIKYYFINYQDNTIILNNVIIYFGGLYASYCIGYNLEKPYFKIISIIIDIFDNFISFWK